MKNETVGTIAKFFDAFQKVNVAAIHHTSNVFSVLNIGTDEVRHSAFLSWLFDPRAEHNEGPRFLRAFLDVVTSSVPLELPHDYQVETELSGVNAIIDIAVHKSGDFLLFIENKTTSPDTRGQHDREIRDMRQLGKTLRVPENRQWAIYLTPNGRHAQGKYRSAWHRAAYNNLGAAFVKLIPEIASARACLLMNDWLETITAFTMTWRNTMTQFTEASRFLGENWATVAAIERAKADLDHELMAILLSVAGELKRQTWWQEGWTFEPYKHGIWTWNTNWLNANGRALVWMGIDPFKASRVFGHNSPPIFHFRPRKGFEEMGNRLREALRVEGFEVLEGKRDLVHRAVLKCARDPAAITTYPEQVHAQLVGLFSDYAAFCMRHREVVEEYVGK
ncbi:MAG: PD-(D/E)XK nuclease family protein [Anaerolineae bacterium]|nr:PD-(D/E)XK nuclease family protein [Anaerolineae bacterium]